MSNLNQHRSASTLKEKRERERETMATHNDRTEIEPLCLTTFVPNVDDELSGRIEDVLPAHHAHCE